jgi:hypothetical protein
MRKKVFYDEQNSELVITSMDDINFMFVITDTTEEHSLNSQAVILDKDDIKDLINDLEYYLSKK